MTLGAVLSLYWTRHYTPHGIAYIFVHNVDEGRMSEAYGMFTSRLKAEETEAQWSTRMNKIRQTFLWKMLKDKLLFTAKPYKNSLDQWIVSNEYITTTKDHSYYLEFKVIRDEKVGYKIDATYDLSPTKEWDYSQPNINEK